MHILDPNCLVRFKENTWKGFHVDGALFTSHGVCVCVSCKRGDWKNVGVYTGSDVIPDPTPSFQDYGNSLNSTKYYLPTVGVGDFNVTQNS